MTAYGKLEIIFHLASLLYRNEFKSINLYFQDESIFGLMTHIGFCLTAKGVKPADIQSKVYK
jgi:hypothetical protein